MAVNIQEKTLFELIMSLQKYMSLQGKLVSLVGDENGVNKIKLALDFAMQQSAKQGVGLRERKADAISYQQEEQLWEMGILGSSTPSSLLQTIFFLMGTNFGLRSGAEHRDLSIDNFEIGEQNGVRFLKYTEKVSKTYKGGLRDRQYKPRSAIAWENTI